MPKKLTKEELEAKIFHIDSNYELVDYSKYQNNNSTIELKHSCGRIISTRFKTFQEGKRSCPCEKRSENGKLRRLNYINNKTSGRGKYLIKENYLENLFENNTEYRLISR